MTFCCHNLLHLSSDWSGVLVNYAGEICCCYFILFFFTSLQVLCLNNQVKTNMFFLFYFLFI